MSKSAQVICLMGPTASGKTDLAVELAQRHSHLQLVSADSALVYRGLDIGTAKPSREILAAAPHRLIDIRDPAEPYTAGNFREDALREIADIHRQGKTPLLVGGSMLYFWVLENGLAHLPPADLTIRSQITAQAADQGWPAVHDQLQQVDAVAAARIHPHDGQRIQRALEVYLLTGVAISAWQEKTPRDLPFSLQHFILTPEHADTLSTRIQQRLQTLFARGFIEEVQNLRLRADIHLDLPAMRTVGYSQVWEYLDGKYGLPTLHERAWFATRQLAKRQMTWLRRWPAASRLILETPLAILSRKIASNF
jgi:tRNA dimethylallyltransferase